MNRHDDRNSKNDSDIGAADGLLSRAELEEKLSLWFPEVSSEAVIKMGAFYDELVRSNKTVNLVSGSGLKTVVSSHFADSLYAGRAVLERIHKQHPIYDVGSGNGFPGLIFGILRPSQSVVLVERDARKAEFLKAAVVSLGIPNVSVEVKDIESFPDASIQNLISRGFGPLPKALMAARKCVGPGGLFFHMKTDSWANEMSKLPSQLFSFWIPSLVAEYRLPEGASRLAIVVTEKTSEA